MKGTAVEIYNTTDRCTSRTVKAELMNVDVEEIRRTLLRDLQSRWEELAHLHEDLASRTITDFLKWSHRRGGKLDQNDALKLARRILQRRVTDYFRSHVRKEALVSASGVDRSIPNRSIELRRLVATVLQLLEELDVKDRDLLLETDNTPLPLTPAEQKRRKWLRNRFRSELEIRFGASLDQLLEQEGD